MSKANDISEWGQYQPQRKNLIINGGFSISQRGVFFSPVTNTEYTVDRWRWENNGTMGGDVEQIINTGVPEGQEAYLRYDVTTVQSPIGSTNFGQFAYFVEGHDLVSTGWHLTLQSKRKDVTLSFWTAHTLSGTYCISLRDDGITASYVAEYTQSVSGVWEYHTITIPAPTIGTWLATNGIGIRLSLNAASGTTYQTTPDTWQSGNFIATSNQVNTFASTSNFLRFSGVQLEVGSEATDFEVRHFAEELALCQRYYNITTALAATGYATGAGQSARCTTAIQFPVNMRSAPTLTFSSITVSQTNTNSALAKVGPATITGVGIGTSSGAAGSMYWYIVGGEIQAEAEL